MAASGKHHQLLLYARLFAMLRPPAFFIALLCGGLRWFAPRIPLLASELAQGLLLVVIALCSLLFLYTLVGPSLSYVQCRPTHLLVSTPLFRLAVSYARIRTVRPVRFAPSDLGWSQRRFLEPFLGMTVVSVDLKSFPLNEKLLRLWLNPYLFAGDATGFLLLTKDWMATSRDIDANRTEWKMRNQPPPPASPLSGLR
jgi:hypothetical protein